MIKKLIKWLVAYSCGIFTVQLFPILEYGNIALFFADLIMNPLKFFVGTSMFTITILVISSFIASVIKKTLLWIKRKRKIELLLLLDYSIIFCFYLLFQRSQWITVCILIFSIIYGIISVSLDKENQFEVD